MFLDEAGEKRADDAAGRKSAVEETVRLRGRALVTKNPWPFFFLLVDNVDDLAEHRGGGAVDSETNESEERAEEYLLFHARACDQPEKHVERDGKN